MTDFAKHDRMYKCSRELHNLQDWDYWIMNVPYLHIPETWNIRALPNFMGTIVRYNIEEIETKNTVSIYLDAYDMLGVMDKPYWEIYPDKYNETSRFNVDDLDTMLKEVALAFIHWDNPLSYDDDDTTNEDDET